MKLVMTLLVRDEADVVDTQLRYHYSAGVDFVVAIDHGSVDGTRDILDCYAREGVLRVLDPPAGDLKQGEWVTRMARVAASEHDADWVLNSDADEFWWPHRGTLKEVLASTPDGFGAIRCLMRHFVPRPDTDAPFYERMIVRHVGMRARDHPFHFQVKIAHRGRADVEVARGNHDARGPGLRLLREWIPIEVLHFPIRSHEQMERKYRRGSVFMAAHVDAVADSLTSRSADDVYSDFLFTDARVAGGLGEGTLAVDTRLRDAVRAIERDGAFAPESELQPATELAFVSDVALFMETDASVQLQHRVDELELRMRALGR